MKQFAVWCILFFGLFAGLSGAYHRYLTHHPRKVLVAVDTSFPMQAVWAQVPEQLDNLQQRRYSVFSLITDKARLHGWQARLHLGQVTPYAPRALTTLLDRQHYPELEVADHVYVVTNARDTSALRADQRWHIVPLHPLAP